METEREDEAMRIGQSVWATMGGYGWREGVISKIGPKWTHLIWPTGSQKAGKRLHAQLRARDPEAYDDKPTVEDAEFANAGGYNT